MCSEYLYHDSDLYLKFNVSIFGVMTHGFHEMIEPAEVKTA